ncbi:MAG: transketolase, partial [Synergistaceae bacterium]|nr:transketolase [Synergistaceae bacterium]
DSLKYYGEGYTFEYGRADKLRAGDDGAIFALGYTAQIALKAADILASKGVEVAVYGVSCPLATDMAALREAAKTPHIITVEDHNANTGIASIMALDAVNAGITLPKFTAIGVTHYGESGKSDAVRAEMGITAENIAAEFLKGRA